MWFIRYSGHEDAERLLRAEANSYGIDGSSRLVFTELRPWIDHIGAKRAADLILDTSLKNGHTTILDALCAGVPVISLEGEHMSNRAGSSALYTLDLDVLTVNSLKEYVEVAVHVATHRHVYQRLRHLVEQRRLTSALFDTAKYTRNFDDAVRSAWEVKKLTILGGARMKHIFPSQVTRARALTPREFPIHSALTQVKDTQDYEARVQTTLDANADIKLRIGGQIAEPSWWIVDEDGGVHVDFVLGMENLYPFPDGSVSALYASHALERCDYGVTDGVERTLREWRRVLKPDGVLYVSVPNLLALSSLYANASTSTEERVFLMGLMFGGQTDARDVHKVGLDEDILGVFLSSAGFCNFTRVDSFDLFPDSSAMVSGMAVRLNMLAQPCPP
jgi:predicted SAM-dependent methyltransferase